VIPGDFTEFLVVFVDGHAALVSFNEFICLGPFENDSLPLEITFLPYEVDDLVEIPYFEESSPVGAGEVVANHIFALDGLLDDFKVLEFVRVGQADLSLLGVEDLQFVLLDFLLEVEAGLFLRVLDFGVRLLGGRLGVVLFLLSAEHLMLELLLRIVGSVGDERFYCIT